MKKVLVLATLLAIGTTSCTKSSLHPFGDDSGHHHSGNDDSGHHSNSNNTNDDNPNNSNGDGDDD
jgi:hypothetical protein